MKPFYVLLSINLILIVLLVIVFIFLGVIYRKNDSGKAAAGDILKDRLKSLLSIKSIVTLVLTEVFAYLAIACKIDKQQFMTVYSVIIAFYFGTQVQKNQDTEKNVKKKAPDELDEQK